VSKSLLRCFPELDSAPQSIVSRKFVFGGIFCGFSDRDLQLEEVQRMLQKRGVTLEPCSTERARSGTSTADSVERSPRALSQHGLDDSNSFFVALPHARHFDACLRCDLDPTSDYAVHVDWAVVPLTPADVKRVAISPVSDCFLQFALSDAPLVTSSATLSARSPQSPPPHPLGNRRSPTLSETECPRSFRSRKNKKQAPCAVKQPVNERLPLYLHEETEPESAGGCSIQ